MYFVSYHTYHMALPPVRYSNGRYSSTRPHTCQRLMLVLGLLSMQCYLSVHAGADLPGDMGWGAQDET